MKKLIKKASVSILTMALTIGTLGMSGATAQETLEREFDIDSEEKCVNDAIAYDNRCEYYLNSRCCPGDF